MSKLKQIIILIAFYVFITSPKTLDYPPMKIGLSFESFKFKEVIEAYNNYQLAYTMIRKKFDLTEFNGILKMYLKSSDNSHSDRFVVDLEDIKEEYERIPRDICSDYEKIQNKIEFIFDHLSFFCEFDKINIKYKNRNADTIIQLQKCVDELETFSNNLSQYKVNLDSKVHNFDISITPKAHSNQAGELNIDYLQNIGNVKYDYNCNITFDFDDTSFVKMIIIESYYDKVSQRFETKYSNKLKYISLNGLTKAINGQYNFEIDYTQHPEILKYLNNYQLCILRVNEKLNFGIELHVVIKGSMLRNLI